MNGKGNIIFKTVHSGNQALSLSFQDGSKLIPYFIFIINSM